MSTNVDLLKQLYGAFAKGDVAAVLGAMDEKIEWLEPESLPYDDQIGPQAIAENVFARLPQDFSEFTVTPDEFVDGGDIVVSLGTYRGTGATTGKKLEAAFAHVWRVKDGKITGFRTHTDTHLWRGVLGVS